MFSPEKIAHFVDFLIFFESGKLIMCMTTVDNNFNGNYNMIIIFSKKCGLLRLRPYWKYRAVFT